MIGELIKGYIELNILFAIFAVVLSIIWLITKKDTFAQLAIIAAIIALPF